MSEFTIVRVDDRIVGVSSWTGGFVPLARRERLLPKREDEVLAEAMYLARKGRHEEAEELLDRFCHGAVSDSPTTCIEA